MIEDFVVYPQKQNQRKARFSQIAAHSRWKDVTLYTDEQRPYKHFRMGRRPAVVATIVVFKAARRTSGSQSAWKAAWDQSSF